MTNLFSKSKRSISTNRGFSLIELSVIISIAASAAVGFLAWTQPQASTNALNSFTTKNKMQEIQKAIDSFRAQKKRLPCPADPLMRNDATRSATGTDYNTPTGTSHDYYVNDFGMEDLDITQTTVNGTTTLGIDCPVSVGAVPAFSLGLDDTYINDAWGRRFTYHVASTICGADAGIETLSDAESQATGCNEISYRNNNGNITITGANTTNAAYVLISHGVNGKGAFLPSGAKLPNGTDDELENSNGDTTYVKTAQSSSFDDLIVFETKDQIESAINRKNIRNISVADCEENSQALKNVTLTESVYMKSGLHNIANYQQINKDQVVSDIGDKGLIGIMKTIQSICVSYYGASAASISGQTWSGAQCPGNNNPSTNGSTYNTSTDSCSCPSGLWDGNCAPTAYPPSTPVLWLDASDPATTIISSDCTGDIANNSGMVGCWKDKISTHNTIQAAPSLRPILHTNVVNGKSTIRFDNSGDVMHVTGITLNAPNSVFIVYDVASNGNHAAFTGGAGWYIGSINDYFTSSLNSIIVGRANITLNQFYIANATDSGSGTGAYYYKNGVSSTSNTNTTQGSGDIYLGAGQGYWPLNGDIAEVLIYDRVPTSSESTFIESYLGDKYNISVTARP